MDGGGRRKRHHCIHCRGLQFTTKGSRAERSDAMFNSNYHELQEISFFDMFRTSLGEFNKNKLVVVATFMPAHFEGEWDKFGACSKTEPYKEGEKEEGYVEEGGEIERQRRREDVTRMAMMRPDGHPGPYMYPNPFVNGVEDRVHNDCVHWCLPGPIDAWNEISLQMVERWKRRT